MNLTLLQPATPENPIRVSDLEPVSNPILSLPQKGIGLPGPCLSRGRILGSYLLENLKCCEDTTNLHEKSCEAR